MCVVELLTRASIGHRQQEGLGVLELEIFVIKLCAINRLSTSSIPSCKISSLDHELLDNAVESRALVRKKYARFAVAFLAGAESTEVFCGLGDNIVVSTSVSMCLNYRI